MPKINRIRIINFHYNNDARIIPDETYNFYDGQNALLNLANGGGKSVLVQLMLQPVIPDFKLQKRAMRGYFKKSNSPAFIIIEWLLDSNKHHKDYLMTGIAMTSQIKAEEENNRLNYFTFASHYDAACDFDLASLPFLESYGDGNQRVLGFERAREEVKKLKSAGKERFYFSRDEGEAYKKLLASFGIFQDEWKNIIAKMNNDEGGIDELFAKCNTSDSVLNDWIIKTIDKATGTFSSDGVKIQELLDSLVGSTIKNEEYITNRENLKNYFVEHKELEASLEEICKALEAVDNVEADLNRMYSLLKREIKNSEADLESIKYDFEELEAQNVSIEKEECSERYYKSKENFVEALEREKEQEEDLNKARKTREALEKEELILRAAEKYTEYKEAKGKLEAFKLKLKITEEESDDSKRFSALEYSLKIKYKEKLEEYKEAINNLQEKLSNNKALIEKLEAEDKKLNKEIQLGSNEIGKLETKLDSFKEFENEVFNKLSIVIKRDLMGKQDEAVIKKINQEIEGKLSKEQGLYNEYIFKIQESDKRLKDTVLSINSESINLNNLQNNINNLVREKETFLEEENENKNILERYDLSFDYLYEKVMLSSWFMNKENSLNDRLRANYEEISSAEEMLKAIKGKSVYVPDKLLKLMEDKDVDYQTGEEYLNNLEEEKRQIQLNRNPLLSYSVIIKEKELEKIKSLNFKESLLRQIIPILTFSSINEAFNVENEIITVSGAVSAITPYEKRLFSDLSKAEYISDLEETIRRYKEITEQLKEELNRLQNSYAKLKTFNYSKDYLPGLISSIEKTSSDIENKQKLIRKIKLEEVQLEELKNRLEENKEIAKNNITIFKGHLELFKSYLAKNKEYLIDFNNCRELKEKENNNNRALEDIKKQLKSLQEERIALEKAVTEKKGQLDVINSRYMIYSNAEESVLLEGELDVLESEYEELRKALNATVEEIRKSIADYTKKLKNAEKSLSLLELQNEDYERITYSEERYSIVIKRIKEEKDIENKRQKEYEKLRDLRVKAEYSLEMATEDLKKIGLETPLNKEEVKGDYAARRKNINLSKSKLNEDKQRINNNINSFSNKCDSIEDLIAISPSSKSSLTLKEDINKQFRELKVELAQKRSSLDEIKKLYESVYSRVLINNKDKHKSITDILSSLENLNINSKDITYDKVYYYLEELMKKKESLSKYLDMYEKQLEEREHTKKQVVDQCNIYANVIYDGIKSITSKSKIKLHDRNRATKMLDINVPEELDKAADKRMEEYIESSLKKLVTLYKDDTSPNLRKYKEMVRDLVAPRELLNVLIGINKIPIRVYKIDLNKNNSGMKYWEEAMAENSGGEKFVVFFTLISILISYTREVTGKIREASVESESKVIIMDNPFAKTSSEHLLKAVVDIAKTFNIQLICLSDLSQSSITNRFSLIYRLCIRKRLYSDKEVLKIEKVNINREGLAQNERLEHAVVYQVFEQGSLFD